MAELMTQLLAAVDEFGPDLKIVDLPGPLPDDGYSALRPPLLGGPLPVLHFIRDEQGIVGGFTSRKAEHDDADDLQRASLKRTYGKRAKIIKETGTFPATSTQLNATNQEQTDD